MHFGLKRKQRNPVAKAKVLRFFRACAREKRFYFGEQLSREYPPLPNNVCDNMLSLSAP